MKVVSQTIPGVRHQQNRMAANWGNQSLIAYGCQSSIVIVEPRTAQVVQTLVHHRAIVTQVCWCPDNVHHSVSSPYCLKLCSVDCNGICVVWDVSMATILCEFSVGSKSVVDLKWLQDNDACRDLVALLIAPNSLAIWNVERGTKVAKCTFYETITHMEFDPFNSSFLVLLSPECLIFVDDFSPTHGTHGSGKKFYMSSHMINSTNSNVKSKPNKSSRRLLSADSLKNEENVPLVDCLQVAFVSSYRHHLLVLYPKEVLILDLNIMQAVGSIFLERNTSPFLQVFACKQRNIIYCLHENGCISVRSCQHKNLPDTVSPSPLEVAEQLEVHYTVQALSEPLRTSRNCTVHELLVCPISELWVVVLMSDGKLLLWELEADESDIDDRGLVTPLPVKSHQLLSLNEQQDDGVEVNDRIPLCLSDLMAPHWYSPPQDADFVHKPVTLRLLLVGVTGGITATPTCIRMCPPLTTKNWPYYVPVLAVGTTNGSVLIYKLNTSCLYKELCIHNHRIQGVEWLSLQALVTFVHSIPSTNGLCRNEAAVTDTQTGHVTYFRKSKTEESPISFIRVSPQKNYLVLVFADKPLELWDAKALCLLKELPSQNPIFPAVEWSQSHLKTIAKKSTDTSTVNYDVALEGTDSNKTSTTSPREIVTFVDSDGSCYHVSVEGSKIKNMTPNPNYLSISNVCYMAWKGDLMVVGDSDGNVLYQDTKNGQSRTIASAKGSVRRIRFAPGKGNTKILILYSNRLDVRDALEEEVCGQIRWGRGEITVEDADWASSDKPILLTSDGCIHVLDCSLQISINVDMNSRELEEPIFCPHANGAQASLQMKCLLQHQPWSLSYNIEPDELDDVDPVQKNIKQLLSVLPLDIKDRLYQAPGIAERCLLTAMLFGDQMEIDFWTVAVYYLSREQGRMKDPTYKPGYSLTKTNPSEDIICPDASASIAIGVVKQQSSVEEILSMSYDQVAMDTKDGRRDSDAFKSEMDKELLKNHPPLDLCYDLAIDSDCYRSLQLDRMLLHDSKRHLYEHNRKCSSSLLLLGQTDKAVQMLLETDPSNPNYITDLLKACLAATIRSSGASQSTIKVVATNLIANSHLMDGIQLLSLIDKGLDACRYLQAYGQWEEAAWLAKSSLCDRDCADVFIRWADHLASPTVNQRVKALLVLLSIGHFQRVIETLHNMRYITHAALFSEACLQYGILQTNQSQTTVLLETVFGDYARYLHSIGFSRAMRHYCTVAGPTGSKLLDQYITSSHKP